MKLFSIVKPGIIFGNIITVCGGFFLASQTVFHPVLLIITIIGMSLIIASGCVFNNYIDRDIDRLMQRTKKRVLANDLLSTKLALTYATVLGIIGFLVIYLGTNPITLLISFIGFFFYVVVYSLWLKRNSIYGTAVGGISGAVPPVVGYCAVTGRFDAGAIILFFILFFWQIPHSYAIAIFRIDDYTAAGIPVLPVKKGSKYTKTNMLICIIGFIIASIMPTIFGYTGIIYLIAAIACGILWLYTWYKGTKKDSIDKKWAKKMFFVSIIIITVLSFMMLVH